MENYLNLAKRIKALADTGLVFTQNEYDIARYEELKEISFEMMELITHQPIKEIKQFYGKVIDYPTPKVDVRGIVLNEKNEILLVKEKADNCWTPPGGWGEVGLSPSENVIKEVKEESGLNVKVERLLAVFDKKCHPHPPQPYYVYKLLFHCIPVGELNFAPDCEILDIGFFPIHQLPDLSVDRILESQLKTAYNQIINQSSITIFD